MSSFSRSTTLCRWPRLRRLIESRRHHHLLVHLLLRHHRHLHHPPWHLLILASSLGLLWLELLGYHLLINHLLLHHQLVAHHLHLLFLRHGGLFASVSLPAHLVLSLWHPHLLHLLHHCHHVGILPTHRLHTLRIKHLLLGWRLILGHRTSDRFSINWFFNLFYRLFLRFNDRCIMGFEDLFNQGMGHGLSLIFNFDYCIILESRCLGHCHSCISLWLLVFGSSLFNLPLSFTPTSCRLFFPFTTLVFLWSARSFLNFNFLFDLLGIRSLLVFVLSLFRRHFFSRLLFDFLSSLQLFSWVICVSWFLDDSWLFNHIFDFFLCLCFSKNSFSC